MSSYAVSRPVDNRFLVRERDRQRTRELLAVALAALPPMAVLFAAIWANLETVRLGYQIEHLEKQRETLVEKRRQLLGDEAKASSLVRVEDIARRELGLSDAVPGQIILVEDAVAKAATGAAPAGPATLPAPVVLPASVPAAEGPANPTEEGF